MEKCICSGLNDNCFFCGGLGFFEPNDKIKDFLAPPPKKTKNNYINTKTTKKVTPIEIILNQNLYSLNILKKIRGILKEYIKRESKIEKIETYKEQIAELERIIFIRVQLSLKRKSKKKSKNVENEFQNKTDRMLTSFEEKKLKKRVDKKSNLAEKILLNEKTPMTESNKKKLMELKFGELRRRLNSSKKNN